MRMFNLLGYRAGVPEVLDLDSIIMPVFTIEVILIELDSCPDLSFSV